MKTKLILFSVGAATLLYFKMFKTYSPPKAADKYIDLITLAEKQHDLPKNLLARVLQQESDFRADAFNAGSGASGIAQIVPRWHPDVSDPFNPNEAIPYAAKYLRYLRDYFGYWDLALAAYNWGMGNVRNTISDHGVSSFEHLPRETQNYVASIIADIKHI